MKTQEHNLFIIDDNTLILASLRNYLTNKFGDLLKISTFVSGANAIENIDKNTSIVILDYHFENENGNDILKSIKDINPNTEVIMFTSNEEIATAIESFQKGASDFIIKDDSGWKKISSRINQIITYPIKLMVREFGISKYLAIFVLTFVSVGAVVYGALVYIA